MIQKNKTEHLENEAQTDGIEHYNYLIMFTFTFVDRSSELLQNQGQ